MGKPMNRAVVLTPYPVDRDDRPNLRALREGDALKRADYEVRYRTFSNAGCPAPTSLLARIWFYRDRISNLTRLVREDAPDLIISHDIETLEAGVRAARHTGAKLIYDCHELWTSLIREHSRLEALIAARLEKRFLPHVDLVLAPCRPILRHLMGKGACRGLLLYNAPPTASVRLSTREEARDRLGYRPEDFVVGYVGGLEQLEEALVPLFQAMAGIPEMKLLLVGGPDNEAETWRWFKRGGRIRVTGYVPFDCLSPYYAAIDVGIILLKNRENYTISLPNKLFSYMAFGVPVLVSGYPEMSSVVRETGCGWPLPGWEFPKTRNEMLRGLLGLLLHGPATRAYMSAAGRKAFLETYAWENQEKVFLSAVGAL